MIRRDVEKSLRNMFERGYKQGYENALKESRPKGEWIRDGVGLFKCSECGRRISTSISEDNPHNDFPFCHCGADMRGE